jgi:phage terminase small subunit
VLTQKQKLFVEAYLANPNATEAARKAGYKGSDETLAVVGHENLRKPQISKLIEVRVETAIITANEVLHGVKKIALEGDRDADRLKAYELLGKNLKLWTDKTELTGANGGAIQTETRVIEPGE